MSKTAWFKFLLVGLLWGIPYLFIKVAVAPGQFTPAFLVFGRLVIGSAILLPIAIRKKTIFPALKELKWIAPYALIEICIPWYFISSGERKITSGLAGLLVATVPFWASLVMAFNGDKTVWHAKRLAGMIVGFIGIVLVVGIESLSGNQSLSAIIFILFSCVCYAIAPATLNVKIPHIDGTAINAIAMVIAGVIYLPFAIAQFPTSAPSHNAIYSLIALGVFPTAMAFVLYFQVMKDFGPARSSMVTYPNTVFAVLLGVIFLHEKFTLGIGLGLPLVLIGSYYATRKIKVTQ